MKLHRLFVIDWIPDRTLSPESLAVRSGLVKLPKKGIRFDCICPDEDVLVGWDAVDSSVPFPMWLCDGSSRIVPCGPTMVDCLIGGSFDTPEEEHAYERVNAIRRATNRGEFDLHQEFPISPRTVFLDRDEPGDTFCEELRVEMAVGVYGELPDHVARMALLRRSYRPLAPAYCAVAAETAIEGPAWLPVEVSTEAGCERSAGVLEFVRAGSQGSRRFDARIYTQRRLRLSAGDLCTRAVRLTIDGAEKCVSTVICRVV